MSVNVWFKGQLIKFVPLAVRYVKYLLKYIVYFSWLIN